MLPSFDPWLSGAVAADVALASHSGHRSLRLRRERRLSNLLVSATRGSRLYRRLIGDPAGRRLQDLPITRKADLMGQFDDWVTDPVVRLDALRRFVADRSHIAEPFLGRYVVWESSGSSGQPGIFVQDATSMAVYDALEALRRPMLRSPMQLLDPFCLGESIVFVGATGGHFASAVSVERARRLSPARARSLHSVSFLQRADRIVAELQALAPTIIATYPSAAVLLAEEHVAGRLKHAPREVWTGGESLSNAMRHFIHRAFGCPVTNSYGASEFLSLASECHCGRMHLNSDWAILESVDDRGNAVPAGETGATCLLTNLANHVQPLIRYDLGDRVTLRPAACACGSPLPVINVQGRSDDTLKLCQPGGQAVSVLPLALCTVLEDDAGLFDFQVVQESPCDLLLRTGLCGHDADVALHRARTVLSAFLEGQGAIGVHIHCRSHAVMTQGRSGKVQRVLAFDGSTRRAPAINVDIRRSPVPHPVVADQPLAHPGEAGGPGGSNDSKATAPRLSTRNHRPGVSKRATRPE
jgi:phenylacetate-CoA ligase